MKKLMLLVMSGGLLLAGLVPFAQSANAAAETFAWSNNRTIIGSDGTSYVKAGETQLFVSAKMPSPACNLDPNGPINGAYKPYKGAALIDRTTKTFGRGYTYTLYTYSKPASGYCQETVREITIASAANENIVYVWVDQGTIQAFPIALTQESSYNWKDSQTYKSTNGIDFTAGDATCPSRLTATVDHRFGRVTQAKSSSSDRAIGTATKEVNGCIVQTSGKNFTLGTPANWAKPAESGTNPLPPNGGGTAETVQAVCSVDSLTWLVCPIISVAQGAVNSLTGVVKNQLQFTPLSDGDTGLKPAWAVFRNLADVFFVLIFFIVIFGTSMGLDNYTVKKILPRLIAAAVLVQFSYLLVGFMVDISNVLGMGIDSLMFAALPHGAKTGNEGVMLITGAIELVGAGVGAGAAALTFAPFLAEFAIPLLLALAAAILGLIAVFITLQIRIMLIDFLIIIAPIAFLLWVLPNTDKYFKMWRETLVKLLLMYPIIVLLLATSKFFSVVITGSGDASNWTKLGAALAPIIALFLIPATFKFAGSALMMGHGFVSGHAKRGHGAIGGMQDKMKQNRAYNRQQKGLSKINALNNGEAPKTRLGRGMASLPGGKSVQRRLAQHQAGMSIDSIDDNRMAGALEKNDRDQLTSASRRLENETPKTLEDKALDQNSDQFTRRAAIAKLSQIEDTGALQRILSSSRYGNDNKNAEWMKATAGNFSGLKEKAPHLVVGEAQAALGGTNKAYDEIKGEKVVKMNEDGAKAMIARHAALTSAVQATAVGSDERKTAETSLDKYTTNMRSVIVGINKSTAGVNNIDVKTRDTLNKVHASVGASILTAEEKANGYEGDIGKAYTAAVQENITRSAGGGPSSGGTSSGGGGSTGPSTGGGGSGSSGVGSPSGSSAPSGGTAPAPQPHPTPLSQPQQAQQVQTILEQHATQTSTPVSSVETQYTSDPTFKAQVDTAQAHNMSVNEVIRAQTPPKPTSTPLSQLQNQPFDESSQPNTPTVSGFGEGKTSSSGLYLPNNYPNSRQLVSSRLAPRDQTDEPGDDRSIS